MEPVKTICENCTGETVINGYCHNCGAGEKPEAEEDLVQTAPFVVEPTPEVVDEPLVPMTPAEDVAVITEGTN